MASPGSSFKEEISTSSEIEVIYHSLEDLHHRRVPIFIEHPQHPSASASTLIADIDDENDKLVLIDILPNKKLDSISQDSIYRFSCEPKLEQSLHFQQKILHLQSQITNFYFLDIPKTIKFIERRETTRYSVEKPVPVYLTSINDTKYQGRLWDVSPKGMRIFFEEDISEKIKMNDLITTYVVPDDNEALIEALLEIRWVSQDSNDKTSFVGGRFIGLNTKQEQSLQRLITRYGQAS